MKQSKTMAKSKHPNKGKLNAGQLRFCQEYVIDLNGSAAAVRAGYSEKSSRELASKLLTKANIKKKIQDLQDKLAEKTGVSAEEIINELKKCGFSNIQDYIKGGNLVVDLSKIPREQAAAVEAIKIEETITMVNDKPVTRVKTTFKMVDKISALEKLGRHAGIFEKDNKQKESRINLINDIPKKK